MMRTFVFRKDVPVPLHLFAHGAFCIYEFERGCDYGMS